MKKTGQLKQDLKRILNIFYNQNLMRGLKMKKNLCLFLIIIVIFLSTCKQQSDNSLLESSQNLELSKEVCNLLNTEYPWVNKNNIRKDKNNINYIYSFQGAINRIKDNKTRDLYFDTEKVSTPVLYLEILLIPQSNMKDEDYIDGWQKKIKKQPHIISNISPKYYKNDIYIEINNEARDHSNHLLYKIDKNNYKDNKIFITVARGISEKMIYDKHGKKYPKEITNSTSNSNVVKEFSEVRKDHTHSFKYLHMTKTPVNVNAEELGYGRYGYYRAFDLNIKDVDIYGNISLEYNTEHIILSPGEAWTSKEDITELPREWFNYFRPEFKDGDWKYIDKPIISFCGVKESKTKVGIKRTMSKNCEISTDDSELIELIENEYNRECNYNKLKVLLTKIKNKCPTYECNLDYKKWDYFIVSVKKSGELETILPKSGNPTFSLKIIVRNYGWIISYQ